MSIKYIRLILILLIFITVNVTATRIKRPGWEANLIYLSQYLKMDINDAENELFLCKDKQTDCESILLFIAKSNLEKARELSKRILYNSSNIENIEDDFFLAVRAAQVFARSGEAKELINILKSEDKDIDDSYILAYSNDYTHSNVILALFLDSKLGYFCLYSNYIDPFLLNNYRNRDALIKKIFSKILGRNKSEHSCALQIIERNEQILDSKYLSIIYKKIINLFYNNNNMRIYEYLDFIDRWYSHFNNNDELTKVLLEYLLKNGYLKNDLNISKVVVNNLLMVHLEPKRKLIYSDNKHLEKSYLGKVRITDGIILLTPLEFMLQKDFKKSWSLYFNEIQEVQLVELLSNLITKSNQTTDRGKKLKYIFNSDIFKKSYVSQSIASNALNKEFPSEVKIIIENLFRKSNNLQKTALIGRYPNHFSSKPIVRVNSNDPWIKLAEITNLLTICKIEVPPVSNELSDPAKLTKYLEDAEALMKDCSRVNP